MNYQRFIMIWGSRTYEVGSSSGFYNPEVYDQGGLYVVSGLLGPRHADPN